MTDFIEKEIKILDIDVAGIIQQLESHGAIKGFSGNIHDIYYDTAKRTLEQQKKRLRIRQQGDTVLITMKEKQKSKLLRENIEDEKVVADFLTAQQLLTEKGFQPVREKKKNRIAYSLGNIHFDIDIYEGIPPILEIEAEDEEIIMQRIKILGLEEKITATYGSRGLFKAYNQVYITH